MTEEFNNDIVNATERRDRGRVLYQYSGGCVRRRGRREKGKDAEEAKSLNLCFWAYLRKQYDCHRMMESYPEKEKCRRDIIADSERRAHLR